MERSVDEIQKMAARAALDKMLMDGYLCICTIDNILKMTGGIPNAKDYEILHLLHCVRFSNMQPELLRGLPVIIQRVLNSEGLEVTFGGAYRLKLMEAS